MDRFGKQINIHYNGRSEDTLPNSGVDSGFSQPPPSEAGSLYSPPDSEEERFCLPLPSEEGSLYSPSPFGRRLRISPSPSGRGLS